MRFEDEKGLWIDFDDQFPSNHRGRYKKCGPWAFPVFPTSISIVGSVPTPYIFDDRCEPSDAAEKIFEVYSLSPDERKARGLLGREWAIGDEAGFTSAQQAERVIENIEELFANWTPRKNYHIIKCDPVKKKVAPHNLVY
jgi:hypothetical protein